MGKREKMTDGEKEKEREKNKAKYMNKKLLAENNEKLSSIEQMAKICSKEMMQFRQYCCSICHRMFRKKGVQKLTPDLKLKLLSNDLPNKKTIEKCLSLLPIINKNIGEHICHTCLSNMKKGPMPAQAIANDLELMPLPKELSNLCDLEFQLLAQVIPFQKIVGLRGGAYQGVKGESVYVPIDPKRVSHTVTTLPRK